MPPAAMTGTSTLPTTCGTSAIVVISPTCPPDSVPSAITAVTPRRQKRCAKATAATTGITLMPASFQAGMYLPGLPAPVVTTGTRSSITTCAKSSALGFMSMMFTPKGLSVSSRQRRMCPRSSSAVRMPPAPMTPSAPAFEQAAANSPVAMFAMPPWMMGYLVPRISFSLFIALFSCRQAGHFACPILSNALILRNF